MAVDESRHQDRVTFVQRDRIGMSREYLTRASAGHDPAVVKRQRAVLERLQTSLVDERISRSVGDLCPDDGRHVEGTLGELDALYRGRLWLLFRGPRKGE